jgi:excisionase family DNA binding protein
MTNHKLLTPQEAADHLAMPHGTLRQWRYHGKGPTFVRVGRHVRYRLEDLDAFLDANAVEPQDAA